MDLPLDYATLKLIWWGLVGVLLIGFALTDGYDLGVQTLLPFIARSDEERRMVIRTVAPAWEGHQVWLITAGGALFAAWPFVYAISFSGFYLAMFIVLSALILRPVGFKYRSRRPEPAWRSGWDWALFTGGMVPALIFGVAMGNVLQGAPFTIDQELRTTYGGNLLGLLNPFALLCGLTSTALLVTHGVSYLNSKLEEGPVRNRALAVGKISALLALALFAIAGVWLQSFGFRLDAPMDPDGLANPLRKSVTAAPGAWFDNYSLHPWMMIAPASGFLGLLLAWFGLSRRSDLAFLGSSLSVVGMIASVGASMFPFILPSSADPRASLMVWDSSSSHLTLLIMLIAVVIFLPIVLVYTAWVLNVLKGRIGPDVVNNDTPY